MLEWEVTQRPNGEYDITRRRLVRLISSPWRKTAITQTWFTVGGIVCDWCRGELNPGSEENEVLHRIDNWRAGHGYG